MNQPAVSVILPVYNAETFLKESLTSILTQSFQDLEIIVINDASADSSENIILSFKDPRIKYFRLTENGGIVKALNMGINYSRGRYIARMDADDIAFPDRLRYQLDFLEKNPEIGLIGTNVEYFGIKNFTSDFVLNDKSLKAKLLFHSPFVHPSVMGRTEWFVKFPYLDTYPHMEDYYQWFRMMKEVKFATLPQVLLKYREHSGGISKVNTFKNSPYLMELFHKILQEVVGEINEGELEVHCLTKLDFPSDPSDRVEEMAKWFVKLKKSIPEQHVFPVKETLNEIESHVERLYYRIAVYNKQAAWKFLKLSESRLKLKHLYYYLRVKSKS